MRPTAIILVISIISSTLGAQNLVPNGGFEETADFQYMDPFSAFQYLDAWYPANKYTLDTTLPGTPDLFDLDNKWPRTDPPNFWNNASDPAAGRFHIGMANHFRYVGYMVPEVVAVELAEPLEAGEFYSVELQFRNKGVFAYEKPPELCVPEDYKVLQILLGQDSVFTVLDEPNKQSYPVASQSFELKHPEMELSGIRGWREVGSCFMAEGGERFFGVSMNFGNFDVDPPCVIYDEHFNNFYVYYFDFDEVKLTRLPEEIRITDTICTGRQTKFNIADLADLPAMQNQIQYRWPDGTIDSVNYLDQGGVYYIDAVLDCSTIPIVLELLDVKCDPAIFVANAFSPNGDGVNDELGPSITVDVPIEEYRFSVFDRWGALIFSTTDLAGSWDGRQHGTIVEQGVYFWLLEYTTLDLEAGPTRQKLGGDVTVIR